MAKPCKQILPKNPFFTYRDPETGRWMITTPNPPKQNETPLSVSSSTLKR